MKYQHICVWPSIRQRLKRRWLLYLSFHVKTNKPKQEYSISASTVRERQTSPKRRVLCRKSSHRAVETEAGGRGAEARSRPARDRKEKGEHFLVSQRFSYVRMTNTLELTQALTQNTSDFILLVLFRLVPSPISDERFAVALSRRRRFTQSLVRRTRRGSTGGDIYRCIRIFTPCVGPVQSIFLGNPQCLLCAADETMFVA